jgi:hypothetical protein
VTSTAARPPKERPAIDPRFARRWVEARREEGRRRLKVVAVAGTLVVVALIGVGLLYSPAFEVRHVTASESRGSGAAAGAPSPSELVTIAGLSGHPLMIKVDGVAAERRLNADPWLADARVERAWPDALHISALVRVPVVAVAAGPAGASSTYALVDPTGRVLGFSPTAPAGLPLLIGPGPLPPSGQWLPGSPGAGADPARPAGQMVEMSAASTSADVPDPVTAALAVADSLPPAVLGEVTNIATSPTLSLTVVAPASQGAAVQFDFGDGSQLQAKVLALQTLLAQADLASVTAVDLSVPSRPEATGPAGTSPGSVSGSASSAG